MLLNKKFFFILFWWLGKIKLILDNHLFFNIIPRTLGVKITKKKIKIIKMFSIFLFTFVNGAVRKERAIHSTASQIFNMLSWQSQMGFFEGDPAFIEEMLNYGCYCQLGNGPIVGQGEPVDALDAYVFFGGFFGFFFYFLVLGFVRRINNVRDVLSMIMLVNH